MVLPCNAGIRKPIVILESIKQQMMQMALPVRIAQLDAKPVTGMARSKTT